MFATTGHLAERRRRLRYSTSRVTGEVSTRTGTLRDMAGSCRRMPTPASVTYMPGEESLPR